MVANGFHFQNILILLDFLLKGIQSDCEGATWGVGRYMRYLVEQAFPLRQCELHNLKHSSSYEDRNIWKVEEYML